MAETPLDDPDHDQEVLKRRLAAVERALVDDEADLEPVPTDHDRIDELERRVDELGAAVQALRGYVGRVRHVNDRVERRADAALRAAADGPGNRDGAGNEDGAWSRDGSDRAVDARDGGNASSPDRLRNP